MYVLIPGRVPCVLWFHTPHLQRPRTYQRKASFIFSFLYFFSSRQLFFGRGYFLYTVKNTTYESNYFFVWRNGFKLATNVRLDRFHVWSFLPLLATSDVLHQ